MNRTRRPIEMVGVVIPAHDEEEHIETTMASVSAAAAVSAVPVEVVVVLDSCSDRTAEIVRIRSSLDESRVWRSVESSCRRASSSRDVGVRALASSIDRRSESRVAILSTDADTVVPADWVAIHLRRLDAGHDAVAGIVDIDPSTAAAWYESWKCEYTSGFSADGWHPHAHSANLSVRLDCLRRAGGFGDLARAEDIDLWWRLDGVGARRLSDRTSVVTTSSRRVGRVDGGFATALRQFAPCEDGSPGRTGRVGGDPTRS